MSEQGGIGKGDIGFDTNGDKAYLLDQAHLPKNTRPVIRPIMKAAVRYQAANRPAAQQEDCLTYLQRTHPEIPDPYSAIEDE